MNKIPNWDDKCRELGLGFIIETFINDDGLMDLRKSDDQTHNNMIFTFGKYKNKKINEVTDYSYLCKVLQHKGWKHYSKELMIAVNNRISELVKIKYLN